VINPAAWFHVTATAQLASAVHAAEARAADGDPTGAATALTDAVATATGRLGPDHLDVLAAAHRLAGLHRQVGALPEARRVLESAQDAGRRIHGAAHPLLLSITYELAVVAHELGNAYEASRNFETLRRLGPDALGADHAYVLAAVDHGSGRTPPPAPAPSTVDWPAAAAPAAPGSAAAPGSPAVLGSPTAPGSPALLGSPAAEDGPAAGNGAGVGDGAADGDGAAAVRESTLDVPADGQRRTVVAAVLAGALALALVGIVALVAAVRDDPSERTAGTAAVPLAPPAGAGDAAATIAPEASPTVSGGAPVAGQAAPAPAATSPRAATSTTAPATPGPATIGGRYLIHAAHTGLCVGEGPELFVNSGRTVLGQHPCASASPAITLEAVAPNVYRILLERSGGRGCADVDYGGTGPGLLLAAADCVDGRADQRFTFEPVTAPTAGYRLRSQAGARYCIGVLEGKTQNGVQIMQDDCRGRASEVFILERR